MNRRRRQAAEQHSWQEEQSLRIMARDRWNDMILRYLYRRRQATTDDVIHNMIITGPVPRSNSYQRRKKQMRLSSEISRALLQLADDGLVRSTRVEREDKSDLMGIIVNHVWELTFDGWVTVADQLASRPG